MTVSDFLLALRRAINVYTEEISNQDVLTQEERRLNCLFLNYAVAYYDILEFYYNTNDITGVNIISIDDITIVLDKFNIVTGEYLQLP
jgi:hypothetical protein